MKVVAAVELARLRWKGKTLEERRAFGRMIRAKGMAKGKRCGGRKKGMGLVVESSPDWPAKIVVVDPTIPLDKRE